MRLGSIYFHLSSLEFIKELSRLEIFFNRNQKIRTEIITSVKFIKLNTDQGDQNNLLETHVEYVKVGKHSALRKSQKGTRKSVILQAVKISMVK